MPSSTRRSSLLVVLLSLAACGDNGDTSGGGGANGGAASSGTGKSTSASASSSASSAQGGIGGGGGGSAQGGGTSSTSTTTSTTTSSTTEASTSADTGAGGGFGACTVEDVSGDCISTANCSGNDFSVSGFCPGPANIECCIAKGETMCDDTAIPLPNKGLKEAAGVGGCPSGMIPISTFCIDQYEASLVDADTGESVSPFFNPGMDHVRAVSIKGAVPQAYIDGTQAADACEASGKRLCTDTEWLRACRGPDNYTYPYGNTRQPGVCNDHRDLHPAVQYYGSYDNSVYSMLDNSCINQLADTVDKSGSLPGCKTEEGAYDMMGNVHEWTADPAGTFRGGYYVDTVINGNGCLYATTAHNDAYWDYSTGFRCCAD